MTYFTITSFPDVGSGWKEARLSLSGVAVCLEMMGLHVTTRHNPEGHIAPKLVPRERPLLPDRVLRLVFPRAVHVDALQFSDVLDRDRREDALAKGFDIV